MILLRILFRLIGMIFAAGIIIGLFVLAAATFGPMVLLVLVALGIIKGIA